MNLPCSIEIYTGSAAELHTFIGNCLMRRLKKCILIFTDIAISTYLHARWGRRVSSCEIAVLNFKQYKLKKITFKHLITMHFFAEYIK